MSLPKSSAPIEVLIAHVCDDGSDYNDGIGGWTSGIWDPGTRTLVVHYERDKEMHDDTDCFDCPYDDTTYRFQLIEGGQ